ncbi:MAG: Lrp/AsnC ligand binding domain-containing protein [Candidatus Heimdallarchaeota archaeon]
MSSKISQIPQITELHSISGEYDYLLKVRVDNLETLGKEVVFTLRKKYGAFRTLTLTSFYTEKEELGNENLGILI